MPSAEESVIFENFLSDWNALTGETNVDMMLATFKGFNYFAWVPHFWPKIYHMPLNADDVIIATFPKSGTTWTQQIVDLVVTEDFQRARQIPIYKRVPFLEFPMYTFNEILDEFASRPSPKIMKTHMAVPHLPKDFKKAKLIYVTRDPRDVVVSFYYHIANGQDENKPFTPFDQFARYFMSGKILFGPFEDSVKSFVELRDSGHDFLWLHYEDMKRDLRGAIRTIAKFLGKADMPEDTVNRIHDETTFEAMRENKATNYSLMHDRPPNEIQFIRKGQVGDWKSHFEPYPELLAEFSSWIHDKVPKETFA